MGIQSTGKALVLSVFLHALFVAWAWDAFNIPANQKQTYTVVNHASSAALVTMTLTYPQTAPLPPEPKRNAVDSSAPPQTPSPPTGQQEPPTKPTILIQDVLPQLKAAKYFTADETNEPAHPINDWVIDNQVFSTGRVYQIWIQIWVLETGEIEKFELIDESLNDELAQKATVNLAQTLMHPAIKDGTPVASIRRLVVVIDKDE